MKSLFALLLALIWFNAQGQEKTMCITVDDLPVVSYGNNDPDFHRQVIQELVQTFDEYDVPAIGYVNEYKLYEEGHIDSNQLQLLEIWLQSGYELGNHTYSHRNYHKVSFDDFTDDIIKGEKISKGLSQKYGSPYHYFRHPYLRHGLSEAHADSLRDFLLQHGYTEAPVTIDNTDYLFAKAYHEAFENENTELMKKIGSAYVDYMTTKLDFYETSSQKLFDRKIAQTLLVHASLLNAHYLDDLIRVFKDYGYHFISQTEVLKDPAYQTEFTRYGDWGISWIDRWALTRGVDRKFFEGNPMTPDFIIKLNN
ncbi:polysaccharide deacetylase family protein [Gracilimonas mengyeensis]|uniref:Polysaccharide deacetylase n=1 Tax=Gracilimonas mengyeensis TaxID=1302730 RepID=A0A521FEN6_9BACT|nr:polysaccharide deacetylase family protein [Gracilimonas mengyeensis]SMO94010.1 Polysaccharide deacetylase [Gracilimonas mengyeensis]